MPSRALRCRSPPKASAQDPQGVLRGAAERDRRRFFFSPACCHPKFTPTFPAALTDTVHLGSARRRAPTARLGARWEGRRDLRWRGQGSGGTCGFLQRPWPPTWQGGHALSFPRCCPGKRRAPCASHCASPRKEALRRPPELFEVHSVPPGTGLERIEQLSRKSLPGESQPGGFLWGCLVVCTHMLEAVGFGNGSAGLDEACLGAAVSCMLRLFIF